MALASKNYERIMLQITILAVIAVIGLSIYIGVLHRLIRGLQKTVGELNKQVKMLNQRLH
jgi:hypothetical protein